MRKAASIAAALALALALAGCAANATERKAPTMSASDMSASSSSSIVSAEQADAEPAASSSSSRADSSSGGVDNPLTEADIENLVFQNGLGAYDSAQIFQGSDGHWYWSVVTRDTQDNPHTFTVDADGVFTSADGTEPYDGSVANNLTEDDLRQIVFDHGLGAYKYANLLEGADGVWYWQVCVGDVRDDDTSCSSTLTAT